MSRLPLQFGCGKHRLAGTLDTAPGTSGLLIVSGGNELRSGAFSGQAKLAAEIARMGFPVFRYDRRGVGDSEGENRGFRKSRKDIQSALEAFRAIAPQVNQVVGFGNCDAASALMLFPDAGCDALVLSNPWTIEGEASDEPEHTPDAIRSRYAEKLKNPREVVRLLKGGVDLKKLAGGLVSSMRKDKGLSGLAEEMREGLAQFDGPVRILLAGKDRTAQVFASRWDKDDTRIHRCEGAGHSYVEADARVWLRDQLLAALRN